MTHYGLNDCTNLSNIIDNMNSLTKSPFPETNCTGFMFCQWLPFDTPRSCAPIASITDSCWSSRNVGSKTCKFHFQSLNISIFIIARDVVTGLLVFINIYHFYFTLRLWQRHTHTSTHVWSAHKRNSDNQAQEPGCERAKGRFSVRDKGPAHTFWWIGKKMLWSMLLLLCIC